MESRSSLSVLPSPDGLAAARRLRAAYAALGPLPTYDEQRLGDFAAFLEVVQLACERGRLRGEMRRLVEQRLNAGMLAKLDAAQPTVVALRRHADRFGDECVAETAAAAVIDLNQRRRVRRPKPLRQRRSTRQLASQVVDLAGRGLVVAAIADTLNVSDRRAKALLAARTDSAKPHEKRLEQADCELRIGRNAPLSQLAIPEVLSL